MHDHLQLKRLVVKGVGWLVIKRIFTQVILTSSSLILVRLLFPKDFGAFAIVQFLVIIFWVFADLGLARALIQQKQEPDVNLLRSVWWTQVGLGLLIISIIWILSPFLISYYTGQLDARATEWIRVLALSQIFVNIGAVSASLLERRLNYRAILVCEIAGLFITQAATILFAAKGFGTISFVYSVFLGRFIALILYFAFSPWRWGFHFDIKDLRSILPFGMSFQLTLWLGIVNGAVIPGFVGRNPGPGGWSGAQAVGLITWAGGVAAICGAAGEIVNQFIFPLMARLQDKKELATLYFKRALWIFAVGTFGAAALLFALAPEITKVLYPRFLPALPAFYLSIIQVVLIAATNLSMSVLMAFGEHRFYRNMNVLWLILQWSLTIPLVLLFGFWGASLAGILVSLTGFFTYVRLNKHLKLSYIRIVQMPFLLAIVDGGMVFWLARTFPVENILQLFFIANLSLAFYLYLVYLVMRQEFVQNLTLSWKIIRSLFDKIF